MKSLLCSLAVGINVSDTLGSLIKICSTPAASFKKMASVTNKEVAWEHLKALQSLYEAQGWSQVVPTHKLAILLYHFSICSAAMKWSRPLRPVFFDKLTITGSRHHSVLIRMSCTGVNTANLMWSLKLKKLRGEILVPIFAQTLVMMEIFSTLAKHAMSLCRSLRWIRANANKSPLSKVRTCFQGADKFSHF